jgi:protein CpxP
MKGHSMQRIWNRIIAGIVLATGALLLASAPALAQQRMRMSVEDQVKILKDSLKLSDDQAAKITKILEDQREERTNALSQNQGDRDAMRAAMQEVAKKTDEKIKGVLSGDQAATYDRMMKARRAQMQRRMRRSGD